MPAHTPESRLELPPIPEDQRDLEVAAWSEPLVIDSYLPEPGHEFPAYLDSRVYQGSSGRVFPLPFHERIDQNKRPHSWQAVHLENEWVRVVVLPELGGRIHIGYDKVADYDFFYRNNVIKPALVGLTGPWISGGVEFNWPQHHRPATFLPTDVEIEREADGSVTVWCSDHDPFARMKGMHGIRLRPDSSRVEARVRLYNRSETPQTFLWWANVAAAVHDDYQSFFPGDVHFVADHARRAVTAFPQADRDYYGIDYAARDADDARIDWYRTIPVPTSYMVTDTAEGFFGGYDHSRDAGFVHWAPPEVSPGKKMWTWGDADFGHQWNDNLTDGDGPYIELMAGVFTDNQPDFAWLAPGELKTFSQYWYPIRQLGPATHAALEVAARFEAVAGRLTLAIAPSERMDAVRIRLLTAEGSALHDTTAAIDPGTTTRVDVALPLGSAGGTFVLERNGRVLLEGATAPTPSEGEPRPATEPPLPADVESIDELYTIGVYLQQYRHATRSPEPYWNEAIRRDTRDTRSLTALGALAYSRAKYSTAAGLLRRAVECQTAWARTPRDGEAAYLLGLALERLEDAECARWFARASWAAAWKVPASFALARFFARHGAVERAIDVLTELVSMAPGHAQSRDLLAALLRATGQDAAATALLTETLAHDPLDQWARWMAGRTVTTDAPTLLDVALEFAAAGLHHDAIAVLDRTLEAAKTTPVGQVQVAPLALYHRAVQLQKLGRVDEARRDRASARASDIRFCQASRLDDADTLFATIEHETTDDVASLLLGNWMYSCARREDAIDFWRAAAVSDRTTVRVIANRNLGLASYNVLGDPDAARHFYEMARAEAEHDAKLLFEFDQLRARLGDDASSRLALLDAFPEQVSSRDDLTVVRAGLLTGAGRAREAIDVLKGRSFQPWEGGEGLVLAAWDAAQLAIAREAIEANDAQTAVAAMRSALHPPVELGEGRHELANVAELHLVMGDALDLLGDVEGARSAWSISAGFTGDFSGMKPREYSEQTVFSALALSRLGRAAESGALTDALAQWIDQLASTPARVDYFATSLPTMLLFVEDVQEARDNELRRLREIMKSHVAP